MYVHIYGICREGSMAEWTLQFIKYICRLNSILDYECFSKVQIKIKYHIKYCNTLTLNTLTGHPNKFRWLFESFSSHKLEISNKSKFNLISFPHFVHCTCPHTHTCMYAHTHTYTYTSIHTPAHIQKERERE